MGRSKSFINYGVFALSVVMHLLVTTPILYGQSGATLDLGYVPQAKSQEELDLYLDIVTSSDAHKRIRKIAVFASEYPQSEWLVRAYQQEMQSYQQLEDAQGTLRAGEKILQLAPDNLNALLTLALVMTRTIDSKPDAAKTLQRATDYAHRALRMVQHVRVPREISLERWRIMRGEMEAQAHEALGHVAAQQGQIKTAVVKFEMAALKNPVPRGPQFYYLGMAYLLSQRNEKARAALRRAQELGPDRIRDLASKELDRLRSHRTR